MICSECGEDHAIERIERIGQLADLMMFVFKKKHVLRDEGLDVCLNVAIAALLSMDPEERSESATAFCDAMRGAIRMSLQ